VLPNDGYGPSDHDGPSHDDSNGAQAQQQH